MVCVSAEQQVRNFPVKVINASVVGNACTIDRNAFPLVPHDVREQMYLVIIYGDGNCLPRSGCIYVPETDYTEGRVRIVLEGVLFEERYLENAILCEGLKKTAN